LTRSLPLTLPSRACASHIPFATSRAAQVGYFFIFFEKIPPEKVRFSAPNLANESVTRVKNDCQKRDEQ
jgi:hypothetical protein